MAATYSGPSLIQLQRDQTISKIGRYVNYPAIASISIIIIRLTHANVWESMGKLCSCTQFIKSCFASRARIHNYQVLLVTCTASEHAMKMMEKIIVTIVPSYTGKKNITHLLLLALLLMLQTRNNTDANKLVIFSSTALYYDDTYIISPCSIGGLERLIYSSACTLRDIIE